MKYKLIYYFTFGLGIVSRIYSISGKFKDATCHGGL